LSSLLLVAVLLSSLLLVAVLLSSLLLVAVLLSLSFWLSFLLQVLSLLFFCILALTHLTARFQGAIPSAIVLYQAWKVWCSHVRNPPSLPPRDTDPTDPVMQVSQLHTLIHLSRLSRIAQEPEATPRANDPVNSGGQSLQIASFSDYDLFDDLFNSIFVRWGDFPKPPINQ
jgi:hypothetical protein